ncbi:MAG: MOSC domain-containing protein [Amphritea sp.]|nr:MOSC domain-containing protein [Amphritea sp.]
MQLSQLTVYPIKSTAGIQLDRALLRYAGLAFDRRFVLSDSRGKFITARTHPRLLQIRSALCPEGLWLTAPDQPALQVEYKALRSDYNPVSVWGENISAQRSPEACNQWFSEFLGQPCELLFFGEQSERQVATHPDHPVGFADGYPLLLISEASLSDLNSRCTSPVMMDQMRPNLVVSGCEAFAEDSWKRIRIGTIELELVSPCSRCVLTTVNPVTATRHPLKEPFSILKQYRRGADGQVYFGQNLIALNEGVLNLNDPVEILEIQDPEQYS